MALKDELKYKFPAAIDNTMRTAYDACERKFLLSHIYNLRKSDPSRHLVFGGAYAKGLEVARIEFYARGNTDKVNYIGKAMLAAIKEWDLELDEMLLDEAKSLPNCLMALLYYFETWPMETDWVGPLGVDHEDPAIEFTFAFPLEISREVPYTDGKVGYHVEPMLYTGRFDMFVDFQGSHAVYDDKTASSLGNAWVNGWNMDSQMTGYIWAGKQAGFETKTAIIRGVSILKASFGHAQAIQHRTDWEINEWHDTLHYNLEHMMSKFKEGPDAYRRSLGQACKAYGGCPYEMLCKKRNWKDWIEPEFHEFVWDPLAIAGVKDE